MELQITNQSGIYQLQGSLTSNNFKKEKELSYVEADASVLMQNNYESKSKFF